MSASAPVPAARRRPDGVRLALAVWSALVFVFLFLPIAYVVIYSFNAGRILAVWEGFGTDWYAVAWANPSIHEAVQHSLVVALLSSIVAVVIGTLAGVALARRPGPWTVPFLGLVFLVLVTPEIVDGIAYLIWFVRIHLSDGILRMIISHSVFSAAVVTLVVRARMSGLDESLEEAAADLGATPSQAFRLVTIPLVLPAVLAGGLLSFTFSLDNTITSSFVSTAGSTTWPVYVFSAIRNGLKGDLAAVSTVMLVVTLIVLGLVAVVLRRSGESADQVAATLTGAA